MFMFETYFVSQCLGDGADVGAQRLSHNIACDAVAATLVRAWLAVAPSATAYVGLLCLRSLRRVIRTFNGNGLLTSPAAGTI